VRGAFRKMTFHFFLIDERLVDSRTSRSRPDPLQPHVYGFVVRVLRHKLAAERFCEDGLNDPEGVAFGYEGDETRPRILMA